MRRALADGTIGLLQTPATRYRLDEVAVWAMDNGAFTNKYPGDAAYLDYLACLQSHRVRCRFVCVPDVVGDAEATLALFAGSLPERIRAGGWPVALVAQDGMTARALPWGEFDALFIGGSTGWKLSPAAEALISAAQEQGKYVHVGRVNSWKRYSHFARMGCDSADGTYIAFAPAKNFPDVLAWMSTPVGGHQ